VRQGSHRRIRRRRSSSRETGLTGNTRSDPAPPGGIATSLPTFSESASYGTRSPPSVATTRRSASIEATRPSMKRAPPDSAIARTSAPASSASYRPERRPGPMPEYQKNRGEITVTETPARANRSSRARL